MRYFVSVAVSIAAAAAAAVAAAVVAAVSAAAAFAAATTSYCCHGCCCHGCYCHNSQLLLLPCCCPCSAGCDCRLPAAGAGRWLPDVCRPHRPLSQPGCSSVESRAGDRPISPRSVNITAHQRRFYTALEPPEAVTL